MPAPAGAVVRLYIDSRQQLGAGDVVRTQSGRRYLVQEQRLQARGKWAGIRQHLVVVVMGAEEPTPPEAVVVDIRWYRRG